MNPNQALTNFGNAIMTELIASMHRKNRVASGKTINEIKMHVEGNERMYIDAPSYIIQLEKGRGKTSPTGPYQRYGGLSFKDSLAFWMSARGIDQGKKPESNQKYGPVLWAIYTEINKKGFPGTPGLITGPLADSAINKAMQDNLGPLADLYVQEVLKDLF